MRHVALILAVAVALALTSAAVPATAQTGEAAMEQTVTWDKGKDKGEETSQSTLPSTGGFVPLDGVGGLLGVGGHRVREHLRKLQLRPLQRGDLRKGPRQEPPRQVFRRPQGGYVRCELTPECWRSDLRVADSVLKHRSSVRTTASFVVENGRPGARRI